MPAMSAMTDGSKRSLTPDAVESLEGFDGFQFVEDVEEILARKLELDVIRDEIDLAKVPQLRIGHYGAAVSAVNNGGIHGAVPLPKGVLSDEEWG